MSLHGKNIIITGATSGFGAKIASVLSNEGASVFIGGRRADKGKQVAKESSATFHVVDVADEVSNKSFFAAAEKHFKGQNVDFILLNSGVEGNPEGSMVENYDYTFNVNVRGIILGLQYGMPLLRKNGTFVLTSSSASSIPFAGAPIYASSKAAVDGLARSYAASFAESEDERIKTLSVVTINPTLYTTEMSNRFTGGSASVQDMLAKMVNPAQRIGQAEELAGIVRDFVRGDLPYQNGDSFVADADTHFPLSEYVHRLKAATA